MKFLLPCCCLLLVFISCQKSKEIIISKIVTSTDTTHFIEYTIQQGQQYCDQDTFQIVNYSELKFTAKFDSTSIYSSVAPENQLDINKLFGFSDNNSDHHQFSARFGWRWNENALQIFGYTYNNGIRRSKQLGAVLLNTENNYSIKVNKTFYTFSLNGVSDTMIRTSTTSTATGYKLFPYFGGDEVAPHFIDIRIKE